MNMEKKYFGTDGIRGKVGVHPITPQFIMHLGWAFGRTLQDREYKKVLIGKDTRLSGYMLESALEAGLVAAGVDVVQLGPMPTPGISFLTKTLPVAGGIVISASHNPYHDNGIKFFNEKGFKLGDPIELAIEAELQRDLMTVENEKVGRAERLAKAPNLYADYCYQLFYNKVKLSGLHCVIDCAHGAMYHIAPKLFERFGAKVTVIGCKPNGLNINESSGSLYPENLVQKVQATQANIGIAFDGDGDRVLLIDEKGEILDGDEILYIIARAKLATGTLQGGVVGTLMTNFGVERAFKDLKIPFVRSAVGDRYVLDELLTKNWQLGGETSGHLIDLSKTTTGDGMVAALLVIEEMVRTQKSLFELKQGLNKYTQTMINVPVPQGKFIVASNQVQQILKEQERRLQGFGRIVLRPSGTEPLVRVMVEAEHTDMTQIVAQTIADVVRACADRMKHKDSASDL
ncbi:MAG TPA: phosphoglucosamine mutase [Gammaproteobacteria bacterium]|nr:phosphoglucosamine mutase [Gammaproteobacteria bacterium]